MSHKVKDAMLICMDPRYMPNKEGDEGEFMPVLKEFMKHHKIPGSYCLRYAGASLAVNDPDHGSSIEKHLKFLVRNGVERLHIVDHLNNCAAFSDVYGEKTGEEEIKLHIEELLKAKMKLSGLFPTLHFPTYYHDTKKIQFVN